MALDNMTYEFEITLPAGRKTFKSQKYKSYERFVKDCEKKCKELGARSGDVTIFCTDEDLKETFARSPEHGELAV